MKIRTALALAASLLLVPATAATASAAELHEPHEGTTVECDGQVLWHFVHNQVARTNTTTGQLTATFAGAGVVVVDAYKVLNRVRHYEIITPGGDMLLGASDDIAEGNLVLSHTECIPGEEEPPPPDECISGTSVTVTWPDVELGFKNVTGLVESAATTTSLLPGTYDVTLTSTDVHHAPGFQPEQDEEQWYVVLTLGGSSVGTTGTISDLPTELVTLTEGVGTVTLTDGADGAVATHKLAGLGYTPYWMSPESVEPTQAVFTCV